MLDRITKDTLVLLSFMLAKLTNRSVCSLSWSLYDQYSWCQNTCNTQSDHHHPSDLSDRHLMAGRVESEFKASSVLKKLITSVQSSSLPSSWSSNKANTAFWLIQLIRYTTWWSPHVVYFLLIHTEHQHESSFSLSFFTLKANTSCDHNDEWTCWSSSSSSSSWLKNVHESSLNELLLTSESSVSHSSRMNLLQVSWWRIFIEDPWLWLMKRALQWCYRAWIIISLSISCVILVLFWYTLRSIWCKIQAKIWRFIQHELGIVRWCPRASLIMMILSCSRWLCNPDPPPTVHWSVHENKFDNGQESYIRGCSREDLTVSQVPDAAANVITIILSPSSNSVFTSLSLFGMSSSPNAWLKECQTWTRCLRW